ncbi:GGDEF domain-containing protein [Natronospora cellulosivora (SeqCode)]
MEQLLKKSNKELIKCLSCYKKIYDGIRIVDPIEKKIIYSIEENKNNKSTCYNFWKMDSHCDNCVSIRAINQNDSFAKVEYNNDKVYMVMSSPVIYDGENYVVELLRDITETGVIPDIDGRSVEEIRNIITLMNQTTIKDCLLGIYNKKYIEERLPVDILNSSISGAPLSIIMCDIDNFKIVNDTHGHIAGDVVLEKFVQTVKDSIRKKYDWIARFGGDEFIIVLINADRKTAYKISEKIRKSINSQDIIYEEKKVQITASFGIYTLESENKSYQEVIQKADQNLYKAKNSGRNKVVNA